MRKIREKLKHYIYQHFISDSNLGMLLGYTGSFGNLELEDKYENLTILKKLYYYSLLSIIRFIKEIIFIITPTTILTSLLISDSLTETKLAFMLIFPIYGLVYLIWRLIINIVSFTYFKYHNKL